MLKSKSFRINHEFDKKPRVHELLYEPKRIRWMKIFVIPLLIAFSLLLVLSNVNFSGESYELVVAPSGESHAIATPTPMAAVITTASSDYNLQTDAVGLDSVEGDNVAEEEDGEEKKDVGAVDVAVQHWSEALAAVPAKSFTCNDNPKCKTIICSGGPIFTILNEMEYFLKWCENNFAVIIEDCTFNKNTISKSTFAGTFKLSSLTIRNCQLNTIDDNAFKLQSMNELMNLTFAGVQLKALNAQTFIGLEALTNFQLFNVLTPTTSPLNANNFLQPMAASLSNLVLQQTEESYSSNTIYDPTRWLGGNSVTVYSQLLYVDLSGTNFNDTLNGNTFEKLSAVQELQLTACSLSMIAENVFHGISSTLKSLDLRNNQLQTLDGGFLATAAVKGISIEFGKNLWSCDCDNVEIIAYMKQVRNNSANETVCATPTALLGTQIRYAQLSCYDTTAATTTTTSEPTTITTYTTEATTIETTKTQPETQPTSSITAMNNSTLLTTPLPTTVIPRTTVGTTEETMETMDTTYTSSSAPMSITSTTTDYITNTIVTTPASTPATTNVTDVSESTDITLRSTIKTTLSPTTSITPNSSTMVATTTTETIAPPWSPMTTTTEDDSTTETAESIATNTPPQTSTTQIIFPGTTIIPIPTTNTAETTETTSTRIETTEIEHTTNIKTTRTTPPASTAPPTLTTCFRNSAPKFLVCTDIIAIRLCDYDVAFNVVPISSRSVQLQIGGNATGLQAIYFPELNGSNIEYIEIGNNRNIDIDNLAPNSSYTFCLIPKGEMRTSPFNCRSAYLPVETAQPWLEYSDVALFYTIAVLITVVCVILGVAAIYFLLRWRPTLLYGNKRVRRIASTSHEVLLFPKPVRSSLDSKTYALSELSKMHASVSDTLTPENYLNIKSYDYMQYFKDAELEQQRKVAHISLNQPPAHRAPALPPNVRDAAAQRGNLERHESAAPRLPAAPVDVLENEYESLDYYQELY